MFVFPKQEQVNVGGVLVGGQVTVPCVLAGTIFYEREGILEDGGGFDKRGAESLLHRQSELSDETGLPCMVDVYAGDASEMRDRFSFVADVFDGPLLLDSTEFGVRRAGVEYASEVGLVDRVVYNSVNVGVTADEIGFLSESDVGSAIVLAFNPADNTLAGRLRVLDDGGGVADRGLLEIAGECGIPRVLLDTGVTPLGEGAGSSLRAVPAFKAKYRLPTGNSIHNAVSGLESDAGAGVLSACANAVAASFGADFLLYGPIEDAEVVFNAVAFAESLLGDAAAELGLRVKEDHPLGKLVG